MHSTIHRRGQKIRRQQNNNEPYYQFALAAASSSSKSLSLTGAKEVEGGGKGWKLEGPGVAVGGVTAPANAMMKKMKE